MIAEATPAHDATRRERSTRVRARMFSILRRLVVPVTLIGIWIAVTSAGLVDPLFVPTPNDIWTAFDGMRSSLPDAIASSVGMTLAGFAIGTALGVTLGLTMAYSLIARDLFGQLFDFLRPVPVFALIPLFVLWFGIGKAPQIALITLGTSVILGVTTLEAIRNVSSIHIRAALTLGADRKRIYRTVIVPSIFPHLLGAIRVAAAASWGLDVAAEFMGAQSGLGYLMIVRQSYLDTAGIVVVVVIYSLLALSLDLIIRTAERPLTRWTDRRAYQGPVAAITGGM